MPAHEVAAKVRHLERLIGRLVWTKADKSSNPEELDNDDVIMVSRCFIILEAVEYLRSNFKRAFHSLERFLADNHEDIGKVAHIIKSRRDFLATGQQLPTQTSQ